jgi:DNA modification methylase
MDVALVPIGSIAPYPNNPRRNESAVAKVAGALKEFGWRQPIVVDRKRVIIVGHTRWEAAKSLGMKEIPVHVAKDLTPAQARAYRIADNRTGEEAEWDLDKLAAELAGLQVDGFNLDLTGFDPGELAASLARSIGSESEADEVPEPRAAIGVEPGDVWLLGSHRLVCGDATKAAVVELAMGKARPHLMVTDPPYGVAYDASWRPKAERFHKKSGKRFSTGNHALGKVENDDRKDWREAWALFPGDVAYVWHAGVYAPDVANGLLASGFIIRSQIIWTKNNFAIGRGDYHWQHEPCWYAVREGRTGHWSGDRKQATVWEIPMMHATQGETDDGRTNHSTQKPVECMRRPIENNSKGGDHIYDPFCGSGTTIIAGEMTGRIVHAIELDPVYVDMAVRRWEVFTGRKAKHEDSGQGLDARTQRLKRKGVKR